MIQTFAYKILKTKSVRLTSTHDWLSCRLRMHIKLARVGSHAKSANIGCRHSRSRNGKSAYVCQERENRCHLDIISSHLLFRLLSVYSFFFCPLLWRYQFFQVLCHLKGLSKCKIVQELCCPLLWRHQFFQALIFFHEKNLSEKVMINLIQHSLLCYKRTWINFFCSSPVVHKRNVSS